MFQKLQEKYPADGEKGHGIRLRVANFFFDKEIEKNAEEYEKMLEIEQAQVSDDTFYFFIFGLIWLSPRFLGLNATLFS